MSGSHSVLPGPGLGLGVLLAAGLGTRLRSAIPKPLHRIAGRPMVAHLAASCAEAGLSRLVVVAGPEDGFAPMRAIVSPHPCVVQTERLGTAHAALCAEQALEATDGDAVILYADVPLVRAATIRALMKQRIAAGAGLSLLSFRAADPAQYGRVITDAAGLVQRIVEFREASTAERAVNLLNAGAFCAPAADLLRWLRAVGNENAKGEYYLTDIVALARAEGATVTHEEASWDEVLGVNSRAELAACEAVAQAGLRAAAMAAGAGLIAPDTVFLSWDTRLAPDVTVHPNVVFGPGVTVEAGAEIRSFSHLEACHVGTGAIVGPFARVRPGSVLGAGSHVGNFCEVKATTLGDGAKVNHLSYIGDAEVGAGTNIGAGTITCNYDGVAKHRTVIGAGAFIGSNTTLIAPVSVGDGALTAGGSTITQDVAADTMAFGRARQVNKSGRAARARNRETG